MSTNPPVIVAEPEPKPTSAAYDEAALLFAHKEASRSDTRRTHLHRGGLFVFWSCLFVGIALFTVWAWNTAAPDRWCFLNAEKQNRLQQVLLSAVTSSFASGIARRWIGSNNSPPQIPPPKQ